MFSYLLEELQFVLVDFKGGLVVKLFVGVLYVLWIIIDFEEDQVFMECFLDVLWGEIVCCKVICDSVGVDDVKEYNLV